MVVTIVNVSDSILVPAGVPARQPVEFRVISRWIYNNGVLPARPAKVIVQPSDSAMVVAMGLVRFEYRRRKYQKFVLLFVGVNRLQHLVYCFLDNRVVF